MFNYVNYIYEHFVVILVKIVNTLVGLNNMKGVVASMNANNMNVGSMLCGAKNMNGAHQRDCMVCGEKEVNSALVPCGHSMFCLECAQRISATGEGMCPICSENVMQAIRIIDS